MAARATWSGYLKISLITIPIKLYTALSSSSKVRLNMLHKDCLGRLKQQYVCAEHGVVERADIVKGYEFEKDKYVEIDQSLLNQIKLETNKTIDIQYFCQASELDAIYLNAPYFLGPADSVAEEAYAVLRSAMEKTGTIAIGRLVMTGREHLVALCPRDGGIVLTTLHYNSEVKQSDGFFEQVKKQQPDDGQVDMFAQLIEQNNQTLDLSNYSDRYNDALTEVIKAKVAGREPEVQAEKETEKVGDFMAALKQSLGQGDIPKPDAAASVKEKEKEPEKETKAAKKRKSS